MYVCDYKTLTRISCETLAREKEVIMNSVPLLNPLEGLFEVFKWPKEVF